MLLRAFAVSCVLVLGGSLPGFAQQPTQKAAVPAESGTTPKRPGGTVTRPKDGVQHPDLDKAWAEYDGALNKSAEEITAAITKQFDAATDRGDLEAAERWQATLAAFEKQGDLPDAKELKASAVAAATTRIKAEQELLKAYDGVVKSLTIQKKISEARLARQECDSLRLSPPPADADQKPQKPQKLIIVNAKYGADTRWADLTRVVSSAVVNDRLFVSPDGPDFGDPAPYARKTLTVEYRFSDGPEQTVSAEQGVPLVIAPPNRPVTNKKAIVLAAFYGAGVRWIDISNQLQRRATPKGLEIRDYGSGNDLAKRDPLVGAHKFIVIFYNQDGIERHAIFADGAPVRVP